MASSRVLSQVVGSVSRFGSSWQEEIDEEDSQLPEVASLLGLGFGSNSHANGRRGHSNALSGSADDHDGVNAGSDEDVDYDEEVAKAGKLSVGSKIAFSFPNLALTAMYLPTAMHVNKFFVDTMLVPPGTLAFTTALARAFDCVIDPFFGWLSDSTTTRWGRRKPYIAVAAPLCALFYFLLFNPPRGISPDHASIWFGIFFGLYLNVPLSLPHHALGPELTQEYEERNSLYAYAEVFALLGVIAAAAAPGVLAEHTSDQHRIFFIVSAAIAVLLVTSYGLMLWLVAEPKQTVSDGYPLIPGLRRAWRNGPFRALVFTSVAGAMAQHSCVLMFPFYISYVVHPEADDMWLSVCLMTYFVSSAISIPVWCHLTRLFDKRSVWLWGWAIFMPAGFLMFFLREGSTVMLLCLVSVMGLSYGGSSYLYKSIQADAIDYDELRTTQRREGQYLTFRSLVPKLIGIPASSISLLVLQSAGFVANRHPQASEVVMTIRIMTTLFPVLLSACALMAATRYPITSDTHRQIAAMIVRRRRAIRESLPMPREIDPVTGSILPEVTGGLAKLSSDFCWFLDHFTEEELRLVLTEGRSALTQHIWVWGLGLSCLVACPGVYMVAQMHETSVRVLGIVTLSISFTMCLWHGLRLRAAHGFTSDKISIFKKGSQEYFRVLTDNMGGSGY